MISHLKARLAATVVTLMIVLQPIGSDAQSAPATAPKVEAGATQMPHISVQTTGKGTPVILVPGLSSPRAVWAGFVPTLAKSHRVYVVQVNGFGGDDPRANLSPGILDGIVADLHTLIATSITGSKLGKPAIVGHSMGGLVALMLAKAHPEDVGKLMIVDSLPYIGEIFAPGATVAALEPQAKAMRAGMAAAYGKPANPAANAALAERMALKPASRTAVAGWAAKADARVAAQAMYEDLTTDLRPAMASIAAPITLVYPWNAVGPTKPVADALYRKAYAPAPRVTFVDIGDAAHFVMLDQPAAFQAALDAFLRR
ncbi:pimeloyl-ACP methyl ester carboxylesterase [Sphingomonas sp. PP-F2F-G114-C0414]|uniref:alpha/beta fold hydrolase n=1 Tax=Sphingomonas sp. PP-F2F-G114-C0414 TaxID=2135662 RepID=UPI000EF86180|nr:alpha/beta hydrolase [Sphingomonas sp. PP-F2F-G114-C0414]RMB36994.1 pimeloyl-ACP methyl ester carboxylesterase [Sphingomonas sp. PP-F2F-G114-C0414]